MPSDLYRFADSNDAAAKLRVNGKEVLVMLENGYATIHREWRKGDVVDLDLPMPIRRVRAVSRSSTIRTGPNMSVR